MTPPADFAGELTHAYVARKPCCPSVEFIGVDDASASLGGELAKLVRDGRRLERVTIQDARTLAVQMYTCKCEPDAAELAVIKRRVKAGKRLRGSFRKSNGGRARR